MRNLLLILMTASFASVSLAQIEVKPSKTTYTRATSQSKYKKTFTVRYPVVTGIDSIDVNKKIYSHTDYWKVFGMSLSENLNDYSWLDSFDYKVDFQGKGLLDITLIMEGSGAYPDTQMKTLVLDLLSGDLLSVGSEFRNFPALLRKIEAKQNAEIIAAKRDAAEQGVDEADFDSLLRRTKWSVNSLEGFSVSKEGVTFLFDYGFPKAVRALEPDGRYSFTWKEIGPHVKQTSALKRLMKN